MQVHVRQQRRNRCPLRRTLRRLRPCPVLDDSRGQPLIDQPQDPLVRDPVLEELPQPVPIKLAKKSRMSASSTQFTFFRQIPTDSASSASCGPRPGRNP